MNNDIRELDINELDAVSGGISTGDEVAVLVADEFFNKRTNALK